MPQLLLRFAKKIHKAKTFGPQIANSKTPRQRGRVQQDSTGPGDFHSIERIAMNLKRLPFHIQLFYTTHLPKWMRVTSATIRAYKTQCQLNTAPRHRQFREPILPRLHRLGLLKKSRVFRVRRASQSELGRRSSNRRSQWRDQRQLAISLSQRLPVLKHWTRARVRWPSLPVSRPPQLHAVPPR